MEEYPDRLTIASTGGPVTGNDEEDKKVWQSNTKKLEAAGVMGIEYSLSCPQGGDGTEGDIVSQNVGLSAKIIDWILEVSDPEVPKLFKLTGAVTSIAAIVIGIKEVFDRYLKKGGEAYIPKKRFHRDKAIELINNAGGFAVLAHPYKLLLENPVEFEIKIRELMAIGLEGLEAFYPLHSREQTELYIEMAMKYDLYITSGTDYHGNNKPEIELGSGIDENLKNIDISLVMPLILKKEQRASRKKRR